jgi:hypothetical protein
MAVKLTAVDDSYPPITAAGLQRGCVKTQTHHICEGHSPLPHLAIVRCSSVWEVVFQNAFAISLKFRVFTQPPAIAVGRARGPVGYSSQRLTPSHIRWASSRRLICVV